MVNDDGTPKYKDYADYIVNHERKPGVGPLAGFRGNGDKSGRGDPNPGQLERYIANGAFGIKRYQRQAAFIRWLTWIIKNLL